MTSKRYKNYFDVVILPPPKIGDYAIRLSKKLRGHNAKWALGKKSFIPHISLYHIPVKPEDFEAFVGELKTIVKGRTPQALTLEKAVLWKKPYRVVLLMANKPTWLKKLYLTIIKKTLKYFDWNYPNLKNLWGIDKVYPVMKRNFKEYGTPMVGRYFMPHITIGAFMDDENMTKAFNELKSEKQSFMVDRVFVCELGKDHSCQRLVREIRFRLPS